MSSKRESNAGRILSPSLSPSPRAFARILVLLRRHPIQGTVSRSRQAKRTGLCSFSKAASANGISFPPSFSFCFETQRRPPARSLDGMSLAKSFRVARFCPSYLSAGPVLKGRAREPRHVLGRGAVRAVGHFFARDVLPLSLGPTRAEKEEARKQVKSSCLRVSFSSPFSHFSFSLLSLLSRALFEREKLHHHHHHQQQQQQQRQQQQKVIVQREASIASETPPAAAAEQAQQEERRKNSMSPAAPVDASASAAAPVGKVDAAAAAAKLEADIAAARELAKTVRRWAW